MHCDRDAIRHGGNFYQSIAGSNDRNDKISDEILLKETRLVILLYQEDYRDDPRQPHMGPISFDGISNIQKHKKIII